MNIQLNDVLTPEQAAARLGCSVLTIRRRIARGLLTPTYLLGRQLLKAEEVDALPPPRRGKRVMQASAGADGDR